MELEDGRAPAPRGHRGHQRPRARRSTARRGRCSSVRSPARPAWSAAICSRSTAGSSSRRVRRSTRTRPTTCVCSSSGTRATPTASSPRSNAPDVPADRWFAMTRLDENRAKTQLAQKAGRARSVRSRTSRSGATTPRRSSPTSRTPRSAGSRRPTSSATTSWLQATFIETVQKRGAAVIEKRGASSAASAAHAAIDSVNSVWRKTPKGDWHSLAVVSRGEYGTPEGLQFGFPVRSNGTELGGRRRPRARRLRARRSCAITTEELAERARRGRVARPDLSGSSTDGVVRWWAQPTPIGELGVVSATRGVSRRHHAARRRPEPPRGARIEQRRSGDRACSSTSTSPDARHRIDAARRPRTVTGSVPAHRPRDAAS